jgi:circadian clock protein KaiC
VVVADASTVRGLQEPPARVSTGVPGLDRILDGGLLRGGSYLFEGPSGTGKTLLANQIAFHHAATGGKVLYFSLLSESHSRLLQYIRSMEFFDARRVGTEIQYLGGYQALEQGTKPLLGLIRQSLHAQGATLLVIDGLLAVAERTDAHTFRSFLHELQVHSELLGCTVLLVSPAQIGEFRPEHSAVDGIFDLCNTSHGQRDIRELRVRKFRGSGHLSGLHKLGIGHGGLQVFPRLEALVASTEAPAAELRAKLSTGVPELDEMMGGGVLAGSTTMVIGAAGTGKTVMGLSFLAAGAALEEPALYFGFYESPQRLIGKAESIGLPLREPSDRGLLRILWQLPLERLIDQAAEEILAHVREQGVKRLVIDGVNGFRQAAATPERTAGFFTALTQELRLLGVTTLLTAESASLFGTEINEPIEGVSAIVENMLLLRYVEYRSSVRRLLGVLKLRESDYDPSLRELRITPQGIRLGGTFEGVESLLSGIAVTRQS